MKKPKKNAEPRRRAAGAVIIALALWIAAAVCLTAAARAEDAPILSLKRIAIAAQVGTDWRRTTDIASGYQSKPAVKLVPIYRLYGPASGLSRGSLSLSFPVKWSLTQEHELEFGTYLSITLLDGRDPK